MEQATGMSGGPRGGELGWFPRFRRKSEECGIWGQAPSLLWETLSRGQTHQQHTFGTNGKKQKASGSRGEAGVVPAAHGIASS